MSDLLSVDDVSATIETRELLLLSIDCEEGGGWGGPRGFVPSTPTPSAGALVSRVCAGRREISVSRRSGRTTSTVRARPSSSVVVVVATVWYLSFWKSVVEMSLFCDLFYAPDRLKLIGFFPSRPASNRFSLSFSPPSVISSNFERPSVTSARSLSRGCQLGALPDASF